MSTLLSSLDLDEDWRTRSTLGRSGEEWSSFVRETIYRLHVNSEAVAVAFKSSFALTVCAPRESDFFRFIWLAIAMCVGQDSKLSSDLAMSCLCPL